MKKVNFLNRHLIDSNETYFEHFIFSFTAALWLVLAGVILALHSIFPFSFIASTSKHVKKINRIMQRRVAILTREKDGASKNQEEESDKE